jgi:hypothetical protein
MFCYNGKLLFMEDQKIFLFRSIAYHVKAIDPYIETPTPTADFGLKAWVNFHGKMQPLPKGTYAGKTVIIGGDDDLVVQKDK